MIGRGRGALNFGVMFIPFKTPGDDTFQSFFIPKSKGRLLYPRNLYGCWISLEVVVEANEGLISP